MAKYSPPLENFRPILPPELEDSPPKIGQIFGFPPLERVTLWVPPLNPSKAPQNLSPPSETGACPRMVKLNLPNYLKYRDNDLPEIVS